MSLGFDIKKDTHHSFFFFDKTHILSRKTFDTIFFYYAILRDYLQKNHYTAYGSPMPLSVGIRTS